MKRSLRDTVMEQRVGKENQNNVNKTDSHTSDGIGRSTDGIGTDDLNAIIGHYSGKSERELMNELYALTERQKATGSFDHGSVKRGVEAISPMLNNEQRRRLNDILNKLS